jgi:RHS repeat-associated protein
MPRNVLFASIAGVLTLTGQSVLASTTGTRSSAYEYNATTGQLTKEIIEGEDSNLCLVSTYTYDAYGNRSGSITRNCNGSASDEAAAPTGAAVFTSRTVSTQYQSGTGYPSGMFVTANTDALNHTETKTYDVRFGRVATHTDANLVKATQTYDAFGRVSLSTKGDGTEVQMSYTFCTGVNGGTASCPALAAYVVKSQPLATDGVTANGPWTQTYYDILNRVLSTQALGFDGSSVIVVATAYDALGHTASKSRPYFSTGTAELTSYTYDSIDRVTLQTNPDTSTRGTSYNGLTVTVTNELSQTKTRVQDSQGQIVSVTDAASQTVNFVHDPFGDLEQTTDPAGNVLIATHDLRGRQIRTVDPDMGTWSYSYDALGQLVQQTSANSKTTTTTYDAAGRIIARAEPDLTSSWTYDTCTNGVGRLCSATSNDGYSRTQTYDAMSRPLVTTVSTDSTYTNSVSYDGNGRVATRNYPGGVTVTLSYTSLGYLQKVTDASSGTVYWQATSADAENHLTGQIYGNGVATTEAFDPKTGRLLTSQAGSGNGVVNLTYTYDYLGNLQTRQDGNQSLIESFPLYDSLNRLKSSSVNSTGAGTVTLSYSYDALGNLISRSDVGTYTYGPVNSRPHAVSSITGTVNTTFSYDNDGNMLTGNGRTVTYSSFDMPVTIGEGAASDTFVYGPEHQRIKRTTASAITIYDNPDNAGSLAYEKDMTTGLVTLEERVFISAHGDPVVMLKRENGTGSFVPYYLHRDPIQSTIAITNSSGAVIERLAYEPFGKRRAPDGASDPSDAIKGVNTDRGFTDHEHLDDLALIDMNGRVFDPLIGRFFSADSNVQFTDDLQSYNRYSYVLNNPLNNRDPSGYFSLFDWFSTELGTVTGGPLGGLASYELHKATVQYLASHQWAYNIAQIAVAAATSEYCGGCGSAMLSADVSYAKTGSYHAALKAGAITYAEAEANTWVGDNSEGMPALNVAEHAALGCVSGLAGGGRCGAGAFSAGFSTAFLPSNYGGSWSDHYVVQAIIGGTASVLGGGNFGNGAVTSSFAYIYNYLVHVWHPGVYGGKFEVGHVLVTNDDGTTVESQFPANGSPLGTNTTKSLEETVDAEGRLADRLYYVATDADEEASGAAAGALEQQKSKWFVIPWFGTTNCSVAAVNVLSAASPSFQSHWSWVVDGIPSPWTVEGVLNNLVNLQKYYGVDTKVYQIR